MTTERGLALVGSALVAGGGCVLALGAAGLMGAALDYIGSGGLQFIVGGVLLVAAALSVVVIAASALGLAMAIRGDRAFFLVSTCSAIALLVWAALASGSATRASQLAPWATLASGSGVLLLLGWKLMDTAGRQ